MASPKQIYTRKLDEITRRYLARETGLTAQGVELLQQLRTDIATQLTLAGEFDVVRLRALQANIEKQVAALEAQLASGMTKAAGQVYLDGGLTVTEPLNAVGYSEVFFSPSQAQILAVSDFSADLIKGITSDMLTKINAQLRRAALGVANPVEVMQAITQLLGTSGTMVTGTISLQVERIIRTELARIFNLAKHNTQKDAAQFVPGLLKRWVATGDSRTRPSHLEAHQRYLDDPIPVDEKFQVGADELDYPGDPAGSPEETIFCRCSSVSIVPEIGILSSPLDDEVRARLDELAAETEEE